jgi:ABC-type hemin transport system substrate-binding protein
MLIRRACIWSLMLALLGIAGTRDSPAAATPLRIISLSPHITELLFAAGAGAQVVGVDDASDYPAAVAGIARVGEPAALDLEGLLKLKPTLIVLWTSGTPARPTAELQRLGLRLYVTDEHRLDDIASTLLEFGRLAGTKPRLRPLPSATGLNSPGCAHSMRTVRGSKSSTRCGTGPCTPCRAGRWSAK